MKSEQGSVLSSYLMGAAVTVFGVAKEPLLTVLGVMIIASGAAAKLAEGRRRKYQAMEAQKQEGSQKGEVA